jgi:magnesium transporter
VFLPITFIAGVYGMNFDYMPELHWRYGYFGALALMLGTAVALLVVFQRKGWLR